MKTDVYKVYDPNGNPIFFDSLRDLRATFNLDADDTHKVFIKRFHTTKDGIEILHFWK